MIEFTEPVHQTKILPLRWFANACERVASRHLTIYLYRSDRNKNISARYHAFLSNLFYKPYFKWGTMYEYSLTNIIKDDEVLDRLGSDYDEDGISYWEK
jgi:hypothetical protein